MYGVPGKTAFEALVEGEIAKRTADVYNRGYLAGFKMASIFWFYLGMVFGAALLVSVLHFIAS